MKQRRTFGCIQRMRKQVYRLRWLDGGRRRSETVYGSRVDAERRMSEIHASIDTSKPHIMTIAEIYKTLTYPEYERASAPRTMDNVRSCWKKYINPEWGTSYVDEIKPSTFQRWLLTLPPNTSTRILGIMRNIMKHAVMLEMIDHNPLDITFEQPTTKTKTFDKAIIHSSDIETYYNAVKYTIVEAPFIFGACAGLRPGETLGVKTGEIEYIDQLAVVEVIREVDANGLIVLNRDGTERTKTEQSNRYAIIMEPYASRLMDLQSQAKLQGYTYITDDGAGQPIGIQALRKHWYKLLDSHNLERILFRNLRPTFATAMHHEYGMQTEDIARLLGHTKPIITYATYERPGKKEMISTFTSGFKNMVRTF
ncbi:MAG: hypothetical protein IKE43_09095 [Coriobacteriales bacterium]|nr:hypothetical protein [Coriobacteriales bacterium]